MGVDKVKNTKVERTVAKATENSSQTIHFKLAEKQLDYYIREEKAAADKVARLFDRDAQ